MSILHTRHGLLLLLAALAASSARAGDVIFIGDFEYSTPIESLRHNGDVAAGTPVDLEPAVVEATRLTNGDTKLALFLRGAGGYQWNAIETYGDALGQPPAVGDCVRVNGVFSDFNGSAEISSMVWWSDTAPLDCIGIPITPAVVLIDSIATDTNPGMTGNQPGLDAESFESSLVTLQNVTVLTSSTDTFEVYDETEGSGVYLLVKDSLYHYGATVGAHLSSITGILNESDSPTDPGNPVYQLLPRSASDIVVAP